MKMEENNITGQFIEMQRKFFYWGDFLFAIAFFLTGFILGRIL